MVAVWMTVFKHTIESGGNPGRGDARYGPIAPGTLSAFAGPVLPSPNC